MCPSDAVIRFSIRQGERRGVADRAVDGAAGLGGVSDWTFDHRAVGDLGVPGAIGHGLGLDVFPAEAARLANAVGGDDGAFGVLAVGLAGQADADQAFAGGEDDAAGGVVPGVALVLAHDGELHAVDGQQFVQRQAQGLGGEDVDFHQRLAAGVVAAQGVVALPVRGEIGEEVLRQARVGAGPTTLLEFGLPAGLPEIGVVGGEAVESERAQAKVGTQRGVKGQ